MLLIKLLKICPLASGPGCKMTPRKNLNWWKKSPSDICQKSRVTVHYCLDSWRWRRADGESCKVLGKNSRRNTSEEPMSGAGGWNAIDWLLVAQYRQVNTLSGSEIYFSFILINSPRSSQLISETSSFLLLAVREERPCFQVHQKSHWFLPPRINLGKFRLGSTYL